MKKFPWEQLIKWYTKFGRHDLPWRDYLLDKETLGYHIWISEILLQQTQVERVRGYFERIIKTYPNISDLSEASYDEFFPYYQGMGYYSRARNILKTAHIIQHQYHGIFPDQSSVLIKLPGVGSYTSEAIRAFAYGIPTLAWDTNLEKVFARYYNGTKDKKLGTLEKEVLENDMKNYIKNIKPQERKIQMARDINNALMDFAALHDLKNAENIDWEDYPIKSGQFYESQGKKEVFEVKKISVFPTPDAEIHVVIHKDHKIYYGNPQHNIYSYFILPPALKRDIRKYIQEYFRNIYGLELSVRPPHKKWLSEDGKPYIAVNAQIQTGNIVFRKYNKKGEEIIDSFT